MIPLVDMKQTKAEREHSPKAMPVDAGSAYPYGLTLRLDEIALKKLRLALPKVGTKMTIHASGIVTSVSANESEDHNHSCVEIQIQRLGIQKGAASMEDAISDGIEDAEKE